MMEAEFLIRTMTRAEVDLAVDWAAAEGWNPGLQDASCFYTADPSGFLIGLLGDQPVATLSVVRYGNTFGFLGFYIVAPDYRGQGYGLSIWRAGLKYLAGRNIGLDGVVAQQENYRRSGFELAYRNIRFEGVGGGEDLGHRKIVALSMLPFETVIDYDRPFFPDKREGFLKCWINRPETKALGVVENEKLIGYGVIRPCRVGYKIGPLFSDSPEIANDLFLALKATAQKDDPVYLDTPETNPEAVSMAEHHGMKVVFETARMYTGASPLLPINRLFGVTTFELG